MVNLELLVMRKGYVSRYVYWGYGAIICSKCLEERDSIYHIPLNGDLTRPAALSCVLVGNSDARLAVALAEVEDGDVVVSERDEVELSVVDAVVSVSAAVDVLSV